MKRSPSRAYTACAEPSELSILARGARSYEAREKPEALVVTTSNTAARRGNCFDTPVTDTIVSMWVKFYGDEEGSR